VTHPWLAEVREGVDGEDAFEEGVREGEKGEAVGDADVVDQDGGVAVLVSDGGGGFGDGCRGGEVAVEVVDVVVCYDNRRGEH